MDTTTTSQSGQNVPKQIPSGAGSDLDEKPTKLQKTTGFFDVISNIATGITAASQTVVEQAKEVGKAMQKTIEDNSILGDFNKMQQEFIQSKQAQELSQGTFPWIGASNEDQLKNQILALSSDKRNFLRDPPSGANFDFDLPAAMPIAAILLQEDLELHKMRFDLVPKMLSETVFWRNYFYRVSLVKQSSLLSGDSASSIADEKKADIDRDDISVASNLDLMDGSVVGDSDAAHCVNPADVSEALAPTLECPSKPQFDEESEKGTDDGWEQELQQTLDSYEVVGGDVDAELDLEQSLSENN